MLPIRVLVVDDAVVIRRMLVDILSAEPDIEVVGTAPNGRITLAKIPQVEPDLITLDIEMPVMGGLECLAEIKQRYPKLPVIMFSTLTERGAAATLDALTLGASDYVTKPSQQGSLAAAAARVREDLVPKIRALCPRPVAGCRPATGDRRPEPEEGPKAVRPLATARRTGRRGRVDVVAIGVSTGGPNALATLIPALPSDLPVPVVVVQHMPPLFTKLLADRLAAKSALRVSEAAAGVELRPGEVWIAPGDYHVCVQREANRFVLMTHQGPAENSCRPSADVLFRSVAEMYRDHALGIVLTGMGQDGLKGAESIHRAGGRVLAQDEASSVVWGMPGLVSRAGIADRVMALDHIAPEIVSRLREWRVPATGARREMGSQDGHS